MLDTDFRAAQLKVAKTLTNVWELARLRRAQQGEAALGGFTRLLSGLPDQPVRKVEWELEGDTDTLGHRFLVVRARTEARLECQRCMQLFDQALKVDTRLLLVESESELEDEESQEDDPEAPDRVLGSMHFDVLELVEDELILALPYVPRHEVCPSLPEALQVQEEGSETGRPSPFSVLAALKKD